MLQVKSQEIGVKKPPPHPPQKKKNLKKSSQPYNIELGQPRTAALVLRWISFLPFNPKKGHGDTRVVSTRLFTTKPKLLKAQSFANLIGSRGLNFLHLQRQVWQASHSWKSLPKGILGPFPKLTHSKFYYFFGVLGLFWFVFVVVV